MGLLYNFDSLTDDSVDLVSGHLSQRDLASFFMSVTVFKTIDFILLCGILLNKHTICSMYTLYSVNFLCTYTVDLPKCAVYSMLNGILYSTMQCDLPFPG